MDISETYSVIQQFIQNKVLLFDKVKEALKNVTLLLEANNNLRPGMIYKLSVLRDVLTMHTQEYEKLKFFEADVAFVMDEYHKLNKTTIDLLFFADKNVSKNHSLKKKKTITEFNNKVHGYFHLQEFQCSLEKSDDVKRPQNNTRSFVISSPNPCVCGNKEFIKDEDRAVCAVCSAEQSMISNMSSFSDVGRVNMANKYTYNRKTHFRDCIMQYQGKQKTFVPDEIYVILTKELTKLGMVNQTINNQLKRFEKVSRVMVLDILKSLNSEDVKKFYDDIVLIHHVLTGQECPDIEYLEDVLLDDFDKLTETYDISMIEDQSTSTEDVKRKNFINAQFVLYQLLRKHGHTCSEMDFLTLKKSERKKYHNNVCKHLFDILGWKYSYGI
jgi:hypothetical protein